MTDAHFLGWDAFDSTNELKLASTHLLIQLHHAASMAFEVQEQDLITLGPPTFTERELEELEVIAQTAEDIVTIERITGQALDPCNARFDDRDRVRLRRARLMWEGRIVHAMRHPVTVTAPQGHPPQVIAITAGTIDVGGAEVPTPDTLMRHPDMTATETGTAPDAGLDARTYRMKPPDGEEFLAWAPGRVQVSGDAELAVTASWDLIGIDEATFSY